MVQVGDFVCKVGESAQENWDLVGQAKKQHWFFHLTDFPSPYVVLECDKQEPNAHIKEHCAEICVEFSKQKNTKKVKVDATSCGNVRVDRRDEVGECDYKNEGKVEVIIVQGGRRRDEASKADEGDAADERSGQNRGRGKKGPAEKDARAAATATPAVASGEHAAVRKSVIGGWATISFQSAAVRDALLRERSEVIVQGGVAVKLQPQVDQKSKEEVPTEIFASWGRKVEEKTPISETELLRCFEALAARAVEAAERVAPARAAGEHVQVRKAAVGGCAVISIQDAAVRNAILALGSEINVSPGVVVKLQPQRDPKTKEEVPTDIFAAWGRKVEDATPVSEVELLRSFEALYDAAVSAASGTSVAASDRPGGGEDPVTAEEVQGAVPPEVQVPVG